jgi:AraC family transcriptional regulator of arabinose operon
MPTSQYVNHSYSAETLHLQSEVLSAGYSFHTKPFYQTRNKGRTFLFRLQTEGVCRALIGGKMERIEPGDILLCKPEDPYELLVDAEIQSNGLLLTSSGDYYVFCSGSWVEHWWQRAPKPQKVRIPLYEGILTIWTQLGIEHSKQGTKSNDMIDYLLRIICLHIDRALHEQSAHPQSPNSFLAYRMKHFIEEHASSPITLEQVAKFAGLSVSRAVHLYKEVFGQSMMQHAIHVRLSIAKERIQYSELTLEQVAESCGFASYSYFHRTFRAHFGQSPKSFRQNHY